MASNTDFYVHIVMVPSSLSVQEESLTLWLDYRTVSATVPAVFGGDNVIPLVISYRQEAVRIWRNIHTFFQFAQYTKRSDAFMDLIFDPLLRPGICRD